jgi:hypothetical protein
MWLPRRRAGVSSFPVRDWERFDAAHPAPTFFAGPKWARALEAALPALAMDPLRISLAGESDLIIPAMRTASSTWASWRRLYAMPFGFYSTIADVDGGLAGPSASARALDILVESGFDSLEYTPWPMMPAPPGPTANCTIRTHEAAVIDMRKGSAVALEGFKGVARRMVGQSERRGVTCRRVSATEGLDAYYAMLADSAKRWNLPRPPFSCDFLRAVLHFGGPAAELWHVRYDGETIAGGIVLYGSTELFFLTAAMRPEYGRLRPSNALNAELIRVAADRGMEWYNLGSSEGIPSVARFKASLGAQPREYQTLQYESRRLRTYLRLRAAALPFFP